MSMKKVCLKVFVLAVALLPAAVILAQPPKPTWNAKGELNRPEGYRNWVYIGTPLTPNDLNPPEAAFPEFHNVYIHPSDFEHYEKTGEFPDGTVIIKELVLVGAKKAVSGNGYFMGNFIGLEATVKDSKRFPDEPGHWTYFSFGHQYPLAESAAAFPTAACNACHQASAAQDFVFTQYYPVLRDAMPGGKATGASAAMRPGTEGFDDIAGAMDGALDRAHQPSAPTNPVATDVPTDSAKLFQYLLDGKYKKLPARETETHPGRGPHSQVGLPVRVFMNSVLAESLRTDRDIHPAGAAAVKEMFNADGTLQGWAVMVKTAAASEGGDGWFWYEITQQEDPKDYVASGNGITLCTGCHSIGQDFVLSHFPLK